MRKLLEYTVTFMDNTCEVFAADTMLEVVQALEKKRLRSIKATGSVTLLTR
jgi:hypothetical protein